MGSQWTPGFGASQLLCDDSIQLQKQEVKYKMA